MFGIEKIVEWWEGEKVESEEILENWVSKSSKSAFGMYGRVVAATGLSTAMELGGGLVDVLKLGEGVKEGGWGYAKDGLRLLSVAGPMLKLGRLAAARWTFDPAPTAGICASVSTTQALRHTATKLFISAKEIADGIGAKPPAGFQEWLPTLKAWGARVKELTDRDLLNILNKGKKLKKRRRGVEDELNEILKVHKKSVALVSVGFWHPLYKKNVGHALYAFRNSRGKLRIVDRSGRRVSSLKKLEDYYPNIGDSWVDSVLIIKNAIITEATSFFSMLALEVNAVAIKHGDGRREVQISPVK